MVSLVGELLPPLPGDGVFAVDALLAPPGKHQPPGGRATTPSIRGRCRRSPKINQQRRLKLKRCICYLKLK